MGPLASADRTPTTDAHASTTLSRGVGERRGRCAAVPARLRGAPSTKDRKRSGAPALHPDGAGRGLSVRARRRRRVTDSRRDAAAQVSRSHIVLRWTTWLGAVLLATLVMYLVRPSLDKVHVTLAF